MVGTKEYLRLRGKRCLTTTYAFSHSYHHLYLEIRRIQTATDVYHYYTHLGQIHMLDWDCIDL